MRTKICKICKIEKSIIDFPFHQKTKNTFRPECRECYNKLRRDLSDEYILSIRRKKQKESYYKNRSSRIEKVKEYQTKKENKKKVYSWQKKLRDKRKKEFFEFKSKLSCSNCGESHVSCLEFHHIDPSKKEGLITKMIYTPNKLKKELKKCIVLCSNCHRKLHYKENKI